MKNKILRKRSLVIATLILSQNSFAGPLEKLEDSWYIGGAVGQSRLQPDGGENWDVSEKNDLAKKVYGGVNISRDFGLEAFWNDFGAATVTNKSGTDADVKYRSYGANVVYHVPSYFGNIHPIVKLGVAKVDTKGEGVDVNQKNSFDIMAGIGAEYELEQGFRIRAEYERFDKDIDQISLGLNWRPTLKPRAKEVVQPVAIPEPPQQRPIVIVNQAEPTPAPAPVIPPPKPIIKTVIKRVPVIVHQPAPAPQPVIQKVIVRTPPPPAPKPKQKTIVHKTLAGGSNFATNSATLTTAGRNALNRMASDLIRDKVAISNIAIIGHTDNVGTHSANQKLSQRRASAVANYLASRGINHGKMTVVGRGEVQPVANNATAAGRAQNRRVNIVVKGSQTIVR